MTLQQIQPDMSSNESGLLAAFGLSGNRDSIDQGRAGRS